MWLLIPILVYTLTYLFVRHVYSYWERKGFPTERTGLSWRFLKQVYKREFHYVDAINEAYHAGREQCWGIYFLFRPILLVRDLKLARTLLENAYGHFNDTKWDYVKGYRKFNLMEKLAPAFSVSRCEMMFRGIEKVTDYMLQHLKAITHDKAEAIYVDMQYILRTYATNIIGNLIYGMDSNNFEQVDCVFKNYIDVTARNYSLTSYTLNHLPKKSSLTYRLRDIIKENVENREEGAVIRKDILQLLVKFRNGNDIGSGFKQNWVIGRTFEREKVISVKKLSKIAEALLNIGLETIASTAILTLYEVLQVPSILLKILEELKSIEGRDCTWEDLQSLKYMDMCLQETLRKYPAVPVIERVCRKNYNIPGSRFTIKEGKTIMIPLMALHRDEQHFADSQKYKPERFAAHDTSSNKDAFIGYGLGSGTCVAQNFSKIVIKIALVKLLQHFHMELTDNKNVELAHNPAPFIKSQEGFKVKLQCRTIKPKFYL